MLKLLNKTMPAGVSRLLEVQWSQRRGNIKQTPSFSKKSQKNPTIRDNSLTISRFQAYYFQAKSYLGMESNPSDAIEKRHDVDVGETLSVSRDGGRGGGLR